MKTSRLSSLTALALAALASTSRADHVGTLLPSVELDGLTQTPAKSFDDFVGRTVVIEYFGIFGDGSLAPASRLNDLQARYGAQGLTVVGITDWNKQLVETWMVKADFKYAYGYDKGAKLKRLMGIEAEPWFALVDPAGTIVWEGVWRNLTDALIEKTLPGSLTKPVWEWPAAARPVRLALSKHKYGDALTEAGKLSAADMGPTIKAEIQDLVNGRVHAMKSALDAKDFLPAQEAASALAKGLEGLPESAEAKKTLDAIQGDKDAERVIKGQKRVREIDNGNLSSAKSLDKAIADLEKLIKEYAGTAAEKDGKILLEALNQRKKTEPRK